MGYTKEKLCRGAPALGGWLMIGHPAIAEIMAAEGFDWIAVDMEHSATDLQTFSQIALALKGTDCDLLVRLPSCDPVLAKAVLDAGAQGIIVPSVNTPEQAAMAAGMVRFPPRGTRGVSLSRATGYGRNFADYVASHNDEVLVIVMLESIKAVAQIDSILTVPGIDAAFIGPYDLSASMNLPGQLDHPQVQEAQQAILEACARSRVPPGIHVVTVDAEEVSRRIHAGYRFIACGIDTIFIMNGCRQFLRRPATNA
jgi:2-dehydro-3-deoxyglucarate aldolase